MQQDLLKDIILEMNRNFNFPKNFLWGASTSAHQIEGNNINSDWWQWEQKGEVKEPSGIACDSYNRFKEDFLLAKKLNHNSHRLSVEWARIEPKEGRFDESATKHYREVLKTFKKLDLKTFVTLHHFTNPLWFSKRGGWENPKSPEIFTRYASYCAKEFGNLVDYWITINEPNVYGSETYLKGTWPPQKKNPLVFLRAYLNMAKAHNKAYKAMKQITPNLPVGLAFHFIRYLNDGGNPLGKVVALLLNKIFLDLSYYPFSNYDFIGVNYYLTYKIKNIIPYFDYKHGKFEYFGWPISPEGLYELLLDLKKYRKPIYITESGLSDSKDKYRKKAIYLHLLSVYKAIEKGVDVRGYLHWSLIDNWEWHWGFKPRFGLIEIDRKNNLKRIPRKSAYYYAKICESNKLIRS